MATDLTSRPSESAMPTNAFGNSFSPLRTMASKTGCVSRGALEMMRRISAVAASRCNASSSARVGE